MRYPVQKQRVVKPNNEGVEATSVEEDITDEMLDKVSERSVRKEYCFTT